MYLSRFKQSGFRNLAPLNLEFDPHVNVFLGENAQGKTNLLEAIYFLAISRSHRTSNDREMIAFGQDFASLAGRVHKRQLDLDLRIVISKKAFFRASERLFTNLVSWYIKQVFWA